MMSSTKSLLSAGDPVEDDIVRMCYLKKMKTMKKKFFVLRKESTLPARLEYYDSEKKFKSGQNPKRSIVLKKCFNINKRADTRVKHCLALYTKDDCFCVVLDSAEDANDWLKSLLEHQHGGVTEPGEVPKPAFEFVWQVKVQEKGLGATYNILGPYRVCLTAKSLSLIKMGCKDENEEERHTYEFSLGSIRRCGASQYFFYMEVGRSSSTGAGELWMVTDDHHIATHMHNAIMHAMSGGSKTTVTTAAATPPSASTTTITTTTTTTTVVGSTETVLDSDMGPKQRLRSSSNIETTKPLVIQRRQTHGNDTMLSFLSGVQAAVAAAAASAASTTPSTTTMSGSSVSGAVYTGSTTITTSSVVTSTSLLSSSTAPSSSATTSEHSLLLGVSGSLGGVVGISSSRERCDSMPCAPRTRTTSEGCVPPTISAPHHPRVLSGLSHSHHLQSGSVHNFLSPSVRPHSMHYGSRVSYSPPIDCSPVSPVSGGCSTEDSAGSSLSIDDTDGGSLPWSESAIHHHQITRSLTDSLPGSTPPRYSSMLDNGRYTGSQLLSPDDSILEENTADIIPWESHIPEEDQQEYMQMDLHSTANLTLPLSSTASTINNNKYPNTKSGSPSQSSCIEMSSPLGSSPRDVSGYMMMSPGADVTPQATTAPPFPRSSGLFITGVASANHSRASSLAEDTPLGYVAMAPSSQFSQSGSHRDDGYVDMAPDHSRGGSLGGSSCSLTSGTPSMTNTADHSNHCSSEYHLEKVSSYFTPSEDEEDLGSNSGASGSLPRHLLLEASQVRPARAYSLGSRPESMLRRHRLDVIQQDVASHLPHVASRDRALSMGSQQKPSATRSPLQQTRHHSPIGVKSGGGGSRIRVGSAPTGTFLSSSWSGSSTASSQSAQRIPHGFQGNREHPHASLEPISTDVNLMEMDFSGTKKSSTASTDYLKYVGVESSVGNDNKISTSPISEEYMDMRKTSKPIDLPKNMVSSPVLPLWGSRAEDRVSPNRGSPSRGSPNKGNTDDYLNMQCGTGRRSQPINITNNQPAASASNKSSTSPNLFSLPGFFSRKNSSGTGTPPKVPERSNSPSPFSSLRRRGKKNAKKNKDKRNSMSSDDTSNVTTPVGMFPFSPSTPSKSFVPEEQFAKCSVDSSSGSFRLTAEDKSTHEPYVMSQPLELAKRKISTALRPPILEQSGGKTIVIGHQDTLQTPTRPRSSSSESEYVSMHPSRRKLSDVAKYTENVTLDNSRKCASDNILDSNTSEFTLISNDRIRHKDYPEDYALLAPVSTSEVKPKIIQAGQPIRKTEDEDYAVMQPGIPATSTQFSILSMSTQPGIPSISTQPGIPAALAQPGISAALAQPGIPATSSQPGIPAKSTQPGMLTISTQPGIPTTSTQPGMPATSAQDDTNAYALMAPSVAGTQSKIIEEPQQSSDDYTVMSFSRTPPMSSISDTKPSERMVLGTLTEHVATMYSDGDYAMLTPHVASSTPPVSGYTPSLTSGLSSTPPVTGRLSSTPPTRFSSTPPTSSKLTPPTKSSSTPPMFVKSLSESPHERKISQPCHLEDYALMIPGDGRSSPKLLGTEGTAQDSEILLASQIPPSSEYNNYALMKPGENIIEHESIFKYIVPDIGEYALLAPNKGFNVALAISKASNDYALMLPGKSSQDKIVTKEKETSENSEANASKLTETKPFLKPSETRKSPSPTSKTSNDDYVLMTPAIKPALLPTDAPIALHLNKPTSPHSPLVVMPTKVTRINEDVVLPLSSKVPLVSSNVVPDSFTVTRATTTNTSASTVPIRSTVVPVASVTIVPTSVAITPSTAVAVIAAATKTNPIVTKSSSIPLSSCKPVQSTPIHIPKMKTTQSCSNKPIASSKAISSCKSIPVSAAARHIPKQQQQNNSSKASNKNSLSTNTTASSNKSSNNKQPLGQKSKCVGGNRRSTSKSPLPSQPELNYASLDLPQCQETNIDDSCSGAPALARNLSSDSSGESDVTSVGTTYAQIDFVRTQQQQQPQQCKKNSAKQERKS